MCLSHNLKFLASPALNYVFNHALCTPIPCFKLCYYTAARILRLKLTGSMFTQYASTRFLCINFVKDCPRDKKTSLHPPTHSLNIISIHQYLVLCSLNMRQQNFYTSISLKSARLRNKRLHPNLPPTSLPPQPRPRESQMTYVYREHGLT